MGNLLKTSLFLTVALLLSMQVAFSAPKEPFCGNSTFAYCNSDSDCQTNGCSGEICGRQGEGGVTPCIFRDCYAASNYSLSCQCIDNRCQWGNQSRVPISPTTTTISSLMDKVKGIYNFLISFNPIVLLILGVILILAAKLAKFVGIILIIIALIGLLLILFH